MAKAGTLLKFRPSNLNHIYTMAKAYRTIPHVSESDKQKFLDRIEIDEQTGCHNWTGRISSQGYGLMRLSGVSYLASRISYTILYGEFPAELCCCHHCDNPKCVNPEHLFLGTHADNMTDKTKKGRGNQPSGERHGSVTKPLSRPRGVKHGLAKLDDAKALEIVRLRKEEGLFHRDIAKRFGVCHAIVGRIINRKIWTHLEF